MYGIAIVPDEVTVAEDNDSQKKYWQNICTNQKKSYFRTQFDFMMKQADQKLSQKGKTLPNQISGSADEAKKREK
ncbi:MAG: hypothetical protein MJ000_09460 [Bacteroidales bacterium]|nr:hypothetical protein [Bacteroidales bacterium]